MEEPYCTIINRNLNDLVNVTNCNISLLVYLQANGILSDGEIDDITTIRIHTEKARTLYHYLLRKPNSSSRLMKALESTLQTGALMIIKKGVEDSSGIKTKITSLISKYGFTSTALLASQYADNVGRIAFGMSPPSTLFIGRNAEINDLHRLITSNTSRTVFVNGREGAGKTELCKQYVQIYKRSFQHNVVWLNAEDELTLSQDFRQLAKATEIFTGAEGTIESVITAIYKHFRDNLIQPLIVFDNAKEISVLKKFLPRFAFSAERLRPFVIVITNKTNSMLAQYGCDRNLVGDENDRMLFVQELKLEDSIQLVRIGLSRDSDYFQDTDMTIVELVQRMHYHPPAIVMTMAFIREERKLDEFYSVQRFLERFALDLSREVIIHPSQENKHFEITFKVWKIIKRKLETQVLEGKVAVNILEQISYCAPDHIPKSMLTHMISDDRAGYFEGGVRSLVNYSLLKPASTGNAKENYSLSRQLRQAIRTDLEMQNREIVTLHSVLSTLQGVRLTSETVGQFISAWKCAEEHDQLIIQFSRFPVPIAEYFESHESYDEAIQFISRALPKLNSVLPVGHISALSLENLLGQAYMSMGRFLEATEQFRGTATRALESLGEYNAFTLETQQCLAESLFRQNKPEESFDLLVQTLTKAKASLGEYHRTTLKLQSKLATNLAKAGKLEEASLMISHELIEKMTKIYVPDNYALLEQRSILAEIFAKMGKRSYFLHQEIYDMLSPHPELSPPLLTTEHKSKVKLLLKSAFFLASELIAQNEFDKALDILILNLERQEALHGKQHPDLNETLTLIGVICLNKDMLSEALQIFKCVQKKYEKMFGATHSKTLFSWKHVATALNKMGRSQEAVSVFEYVVNQLHTKYEGKKAIFI